MRDYSVISGETITIRRTNPRTPIFIYTLFMTAVMVFTVLFFVPAQEAILFFIVPVMIFVMFLNLRIWGLLTTITIGPDGVKFKSLLRERLFPWPEIRSAGIYVKSRNSVMPLNREQFNDNFYLRLKYVWLSVSPNYQPENFEFSRETYCDWEFRQEAWVLFNRYLIGTPEPGTVPGIGHYGMSEPQRNNQMH